MRMQQRLEELVEAWMADRDRGVNRTAAEMCADSPELANELDRRIRMMIHFEQLGDVRLSDTQDSRCQTDTSRSPVLPSLPGNQRRAAPTSIGGFQLLEMLGEGGMGAVYLAQDPQLDRRVAVKIMKRDLAADPDAVRRFLREARAMAAIEHDNIMTIHAVGDDQGIPYLVMPAIQGETLEARLQREQRLSIAESVRMGGEIADGLAAAHARGLIHRDIKPGNIWLEQARGRVRILDFGLVRPLDDDQRATRSGVILGTPAYMAPEQAAGCEATTRSDLFSLGAVLYRMVTGIQPFAGANLVATLNNLSGKTPEAPRKVNPEVRPLLSDLIAQLLSKSPDERPGSADEVSRRLRSLDGDKSPATQTTVTGRRSDLATHVGSTLPDVRHRRLSNRWLAASLGALALMAAVVVYRIQTDHGTLVVRIDDDEVEAKLGSDGLVIEDAKTGRTWRLRPRLSQRLPSGNYQLPTVPGLEMSVSDDSGAEFSTREFSIRRGDRTTVCVKLMETNAKRPPESPDHGAPRRPLWSGWTVDGPPPAIAPFDARQARIHQENWAKHLGVPVEYTNSVGMRFRLVPPGEFLMGSTAAEIEAALEEAREPAGVVQVQGEAPRHPVVLTRPFFLGVHEVTQKNYVRIAKVNPSYFSSDGVAKSVVAGEDTAENPVEGVTWYDAISLCNELSKLEQRAARYRISESGGVETTEGTGYRLPTEAEWEFACRAGATAPLIPDGDNSQSILPGWYQPLADGRPHPVGQLPPNPFGFRDMTGNVWEWLQDWYQAGYYSQLGETPAVDPHGPAIGARKMIRGGSWNDLATWCRPAYRANYSPNAKIGSFGVRLALSVDSVRIELKRERAD